jgi:hypothetical protein
VPIVLVGLEAVARAWRQSAPGPLADRLRGVLLLALGVTAAGGLGLLVGGAQPREPLHYLYAVLALVAVPISDSVSRNATPRTRGIANLVGAVVALVIVARLFGTG